MSGSKQLSQIKSTLMSTPSTIVYNCLPSSYSPTSTTNQNKSIPRTKANYNKTIDNHNPPHFILTSDNQLHESCDKLKQLRSTQKKMKEVTKSVNQSKPPVKSIVKTHEMLKKGDINSNQFKQKSNPSVKSTHQTTTTRTAKKSCHLQDLCLEDRRKLNKLIMKLAEAQEALKIMDCKLQNQSVNNNDNGSNNILELKCPTDGNQIQYSQPTLEEGTVYSSKAEELIITYKTRLEQLENELSQLRHHHHHFKGEEEDNYLPPYVENNSSAKKYPIELHPTVINDEKNLHNLDKDVNQRGMQSSDHRQPHCHNHQKLLSLTSDGNCQKSNNHKTANQPISNSTDLKSSNILQKVENENEKRTNDSADDINRNQDHSILMNGQLRQESTIQEFPVWELSDPFSNSSGKAKSDNKTPVPASSNKLVEKAKKKQKKKEVSIMTQIGDLMSTENYAVSEISASADKYTQTINETHKTSSQSHDKYTECSEQADSALPTKVLQVRQISTEIQCSTGNTDRIKPLRDSCVQTSFVANDYFMIKCGNKRINKSSRQMHRKGTPQWNRTKLSTERQNRSSSSSSSISESSPYSSPSSSSLSDGSDVNNRSDNNNNMKLTAKNSRQRKMNQNGERSKQHFRQSLDISNSISDQINQKLPVHSGE
ncbi:unnamed protein product [Trichobilharzia szidati]|nr:unnamed protein product [Trichobilharzia szidati]